MKLPPIFDKVAKVLGVLLSVFQQGRQAGLWQQGQGPGSVGPSDQPPPGSTKPRLLIGEGEVRMGNGYSLWTGLWKTALLALQLTVCAALTHAAAVPEGAIGAALTAFGVKPEFAAPLAGVLMVLFRFGGNWAKHAGPMLPPPGAALAVVFALLTPLLLMLAFAAPTVHASPCGFQTNSDPFDFETITVSTAALGFTSATYAPTGEQPADMAAVSLETAGIRWRADGVDPTAAIGHPLPASTEFVVCGRATVRTFRAIRSGGSDATMRVTYFRAQG